MVARLSAFAAEVTRVAREVGTEGKLGGQATVEDVSGTCSVSRVCEPARRQPDDAGPCDRRGGTAVTSGDLTRRSPSTRPVRVADLKDNING